ncbi:MAG: serine protease [Firmicutes bacterium]|nr:serine protease [Bacillota bacterium]
MRSSNKFKKAMIVATVCLLSIATLAGCALFASTGPRGAPGRDGNTVVTSYVDYLHFLWNANDDQFGVRAYFGGDFERFMREFPKRFLHMQGPQGPGGKFETATVANDVMRSTVDITTSGNMFSSGAGVIYYLETTAGLSNDVTSVDRFTGRGFVITNWHVVFRTRSAGEQEPAANVQLYLFGLRPFGIAIPARVIGGSVEHDVAVLEFDGGRSLVNREGLDISTPWETSRGLINSRVNRIDNGSGGLKVNPDTSYDAIAPARLPTEIGGFFGCVPVGRTIFAVGNPIGNAMSFTEGTVSVSSEVIRLDAMDGQGVQIDGRGWVFNRVMRISAAINSGNSGGGVFNQSRELVGITQARMMWHNEPRDPVDNIAYVIPLDVAIPIARQIIDRAGGTTNYVAWLNRVDARFTVYDRNPHVEFINGMLTLTANVFIDEITGASRPNLGVGTQLLSVKIYQDGISDPQRFTLTRAHQFRELMIRGYGDHQRVYVGVRIDVGDAITYLQL